MLIKITIALLSVFLFTGCVTKYVYVDKNIYLKPPGTIIDINITTPKFNISKNEYIYSKPIVKENYLSNYIIELLNTVHKYKIKNNKIKQWYKDVNATVVK